MRFRQLFLIIFASFWSFVGQAQETQPTVSPTATYTNDDGDMIETSDDFAGQAPLSVAFRANPDDMEGYNPIYEWHFRMEGESKDFMVRYEENTEYTFSASGTTIVTLNVILNDKHVIDPFVICVTISESKLSFPNAFSPNGDGINDIYRAKEYQSLVEFHGGWDGKYNGKDVSDGVYFVLVKAKGADGCNYNIRKDVNLLRGYSEEVRK